MPFATSGLRMQRSMAQAVMEMGGVTLALGVVSSCMVARSESEAVEVGVGRDAKREASLLVVD